MQSLTNHPQDLYVLHVMDGGWRRVLSARSFKYSSYEKAARDNPAKEEIRNVPDEDFVSNYVHIRYSHVLRRTKQVHEIFLRQG